MQDRYSENFNKFLEKRNYQIRNGRIRIGTTWVNKDDLLYDISHMAEKPSSFNLQKTTHEKIFRDLKKKGMAASLIRNRKLRDLFKEARPISALSPPTSARSSSDSEYGLDELFKKRSPLPTHIPTPNWGMSTRAVRRGKK